MDIVNIINTAFPYFLLQFSESFICSEFISTDQITINRKFTSKSMGP